MKYTIALILLISNLSVGAQSSTKDATSSPAMPGVVYRSPVQGLVSEQTLLAPLRMSNLSGRQQRLASNNLLNLKVKFPILLKPTTTVVAGVSYQKEEYLFDARSFDFADPLLAGLNDTDLRTTRFSLYAVRSLNERFYLGFGADAMFSGTYESLTENLGSYGMYRATVVLGYKPTDFSEFALGVLYSDDFRGRRVLPVASLNHTINKKWGLEFVIPVKMKARYNFNQRSLLLFGTDYVSQSYAIDNQYDSEQMHHFRRSAISLNAKYQYNVRGWVWLQAQAGYNFNFRNQVDNFQMNSTLRLRQGGAPMFNIGIFLSPTRRS